VTTYVLPGENKCDEGLRRKKCDFLGCDEECDCRTEMWNGPHRAKSQGCKERHYNMYRECNI